MTNKFKNPMWTELNNGGKVYFHKNNIPELAVPNFWDIFWNEQKNLTDPVGNESMPLPTQDIVLVRPETVVWKRSDAPPNEQISLFGLNSNQVYDYLIKGFAGWKPIWFGLFQMVELPAGVVELSFEIFPDVYMNGGGGAKLPNTDPNSVEFRLFVGTQKTNWINSDIIQDLGWTDLTRTFVTPDAGLYSCGVEYRGRHGLDNNGIFIRNPRIVIKSQVPNPVPEPTPTDSNDIKFALTLLVSTLENVTALAKWIVNKL